MEGGSRFTVLAIFAALASVALIVVTMALVSGRNTQKTVIYRSVLHDVAVTSRPGGESTDPPLVEPRHDLDLEVILIEGNALPVILHWSTRKDGTLGLQQDWGTFLSEVRIHLWGMVQAELPEGISPDEFDSALADSLFKVGVLQKVAEGPSGGESSATEDFLWVVRQDHHNQIAVYRGR